MLAYNKRKILNGGREMKKKILSIISAILIGVASVVASSASWWVLYQPKAPKSIK